MTDDEENALAALLRHATYSFAPIYWDYAKLTAEEKTLISPEELELIRKMTLEPRV
jgi:hypothetical protein